jgi:hypothetical protein
MIVLALAPSRGITRPQARVRRASIDLSVYRKIFFQSLGCDGFLNPLRAIFLVAE